MVFHKALLHERFVVVADLLNVYVTLSVDVWLGGRVAVCHGHYAGDVLEHVVTVDLHLYTGTSQLAFTAQYVCPSVRHTPVCCRKGCTILILFSPSGSHAILVFLVPNGMEYSDRDPLTVTPNARRYEKTAVFDQ